MVFLLAVSNTMYFHFQDQNHGFIVKNCYSLFINQPYRNQQNIAFMPYSTVLKYSNLKLD